MTLAKRPTLQRSYRNQLDCLRVDLTLVKFDRKLDFVTDVEARTTRKTVSPQMDRNARFEKTLQRHPPAGKSMVGARTVNDMATRLCEATNLVVGQVHAVRE